MRRLRILTKLTLVIPLLASPVYAYVTIRALSSSNRIVQVKWSNGAFPIPWRMNSAVGSNITGTREYGDEVRQSFQSWSSVPTATVSFAEGSPASASVKLAYDGMNVVSTNVTSSEWSAYAVGSGTLAFTALSWSNSVGTVDPLGRAVTFSGQIMEADIVFNPDVQFGTDAIQGSINVGFQAVLTHEIGHLLGLDHSPVVGSAMFWAQVIGMTTLKPLLADDIAGISNIYPSAGFASKGGLSGTIRTTANQPVYGAVVVALNSIGQPVASAITDPNGQYVIMGLEPGSYTVYAEPLDGPTTSSNVPTLEDIYPGRTVNRTFTTRFR